MRVENMESSSGNAITNQFIIYGDDGTYFQSYNTIIAFWPFGGKVQLDADRWDYSVTTGKYRNIFLGEDKRATGKKIKSGEYTLVNLN